MLFLLHPAIGLVLEHILYELLDTLADNALTWSRVRVLRSFPDMIKLGQDGVILLAGKLAALGAISLLGDHLLDCLTDLLNEPDGRLDGVIIELLVVEKPLKDRLGNIMTKQMHSEELTDELNVAEELMLTLEADLSVVVLSVRLSGILCLLLQLLETGLLEDLLKAASAMAEKFVSELAEFEIVWVGAFALRL